MVFNQFLKLAAFGLSTVGLLANTLASDALITNTERFRIPFSVEAYSSSDTGGHAILFASRDDGPVEQVQRVPTSAGGFEFTAPGDGLYSFAVRMTDSRGNPLSDEPVEPELHVRVDTQAPDLNLEIIDLSGGMAAVRWAIEHEQIAPGSLQVQYSEGSNGRWHDVQVSPSAQSGQANIQVSPGAAVSVRGTAIDLAGNESTAGTQQVLSQSHPPVATSRTSGLSIPSQSSGALNSTPWSAPMPDVDTAPSIPKTGSRLDLNHIGFKTQPSDYNSSIHPVSQAFDATSDLQQQTVNSSLFDIAYQIDDVGPSGVGSVELFVTEDNGRQWFRYGNDADLRSPFQVDVQGEGTFGFTIRVRNGLGFSNPPPQPGETPDIVITVDKTAPQIHFLQPQIQTIEQGYVQLDWTVRETAGATPVRLEYSASPSGPWVPIFDWQSDPRQFQWPIRPGVPQSVYFRILAKDTAGNVGSAKTARPVLIDQNRPTARVLRIQPVMRNVNVGPGY